MLKKRLVLSFALVFVLSLCACTPSTPSEVDTTTKFTSEGFTLSVPNEYVDLLLVDTTVTDAKDGIFFSVREKASVEAAKKMYPGDDTIDGGLLFSIGRVDEATFHDMMIWGMTGADVFARDEEGYYYIYYHPTDVQLIRMEYTDADWEQWRKLGQWASQAEQFFVDDNSGLTPYQRTYKDIDCALHYIAYGEGAAYLRYKHSDAIYTPERADSLPYLEQLLDDVMYFDLLRDDEFDPEGNYISLTAPEMFQYTSFDFFIDEGQQNIIRQNYDDIEPIYFAADKNGEKFPVGQIVSDWLSSLEPAPLSDLELTLRRLSYLNTDEIILKHSNTAETLTPTKNLSRPYMRQLMNGTLTAADGHEIPDCEYITLTFFDEGLRFEFYLSDHEQGTYVLRGQRGGFDDLFLLTCENGASAAKLMQDWYNAAKLEQ